jgi:hypothetical protein
MAATTGARPAPTPPIEERAWPGERDNRRRWNGQPGFYEVWYLTLNHRPSQTGAWLRYTLEAPLSGEPHAALWFAHFDARDPERTFAIHRELPAGEMVAKDSPFAVSLPGALLGHDRARGALAGGGHRAAWDLTWTPAPRTHRKLPPLF